MYVSIDGDRDISKLANFTNRRLPADSSGLQWFCLDSSRSFFRGLNRAKVLGKYLKILVFWYFKNLCTRIESDKKSDRVDRISKVRRSDRYDRRGTCVARHTFHKWRERNNRLMRLSFSKRGVRTILRRSRTRTKSFTGLRVIEAGGNIVGSLVV